VQIIRRSLTVIAGALARIAPALTALGQSASAGSRRGRKLNLSPERRAVLKLQGQYMGHLRGLRGRQKAEVKALKAAKGFNAAIRLARKLSAA
jgi:hypothetical protein